MGVLVGGSVGGTVVREPEQTSPISIFRAFNLSIMLAQPEVNYKKKKIDVFQNHTTSS